MCADRKQRPVQLQINNSGSWKTIAKFDAGDEAAAHYAKQGVERLALADAGPSAARWRIATCDALPLVLMRFDAAGGWRAEGPR